jgi:aspartate 1-decarboxylase
MICLNGAAARLVQKGDIVIIITYTILQDEEYQNFKPKRVFVNEKNEINEIS